MKIVEGKQRETELIAVVPQQLVSRYSLNHSHQGIVMVGNLMHKRSDINE
jgi:hypothetical protein